MDGIELLAPAGSFETALAAFEYGADAVYLGLDSFSARAQAVNFSTEELADLLAYSRVKGRKVYVTFNTLLSDGDLPAAVGKLALLEELSPDALIVQDLGVARLVRREFPSLAIHASTQLVAHNLEGVIAMKELGFSRVVLARELPIEDVRSIVKRCGCEIEVFVHGALCYSVSGLCLFSAMEKRRSGNKGRCAYCCRLAYRDADGNRTRPFSMKDLRLDDRLDALRDAGVASLKIEGRMKSALYVASVVKRYRELLDGGVSGTTREDLETVYSRSTTRLYADGWRRNAEDVIDPLNLGHQGTLVGRVKRLTKDRDGRSWLRFHTGRALEKHDGLQFVVPGVQPDDGRPLGMGIGEMRLAISRAPTFEAPAGSDVEIEVTDPNLVETFSAMERDRRCGAIEVRCSMSNAVKRRFSAPSFRAADYPGAKRLDVSVRIAAGRVEASSGGEIVYMDIPSMQKAEHPERTSEVVRKCFEKLGGTGWSLASLSIADPEGLFVPMSALNELRRSLVRRLDEARIRRREEKVERICASLGSEARCAAFTGKVVKVRLGQAVPPGDWDEVVVAIGHGGEVSELDASVRLALPVFTREEDFNRLRGRVKSLLRAGFRKWEAADLAGLRMLRAAGVEDITADWSLYALNSQAVSALADLGVSRCVMSPESDASEEASAFPVPVEYLVRQSTPLFISVTRPAVEDPSRLTDEAGVEFTAFEMDGLWVTVRTQPRTFAAPEGSAVRTDLSWDRHPLHEQK